MAYDAAPLREKAHQARLWITPDRIMALLALAAIALVLCPWVTVPLADQLGYDISLSLPALADLADQLAYYAQQARLAVETLRDAIALVGTALEQLGNLAEWLGDLASALGSQFAGPGW